MSAGPRRARRAGRGGRRAGLLLAGAAVLALAGLGAAAAVVEHLGLAPRALAPYVEKRSSGHNPAIVAAGAFASRTLLQLDRGEPAGPPGAAELRALALGAQPLPAGAAGSGTLVMEADGLRQALAQAQPGETITLAPGDYRFAGRPLDASRPGRADAPIVVRAAQPGSVRIEFAQVEGFRVSAPYWRFENLAIRGTCGEDSQCEHAFHVIGAAHHFAAVNNAVADFNAHVKINGEGGAFPDDGLLESNTLFNTHARRTANPVVPIDLVAASRWTIRANVIKDFVKLEGNRVSYGAFVKGGGGANVFERNLVWCEDRLRGLPGQRVGLSLGGGGTDKPFCRDGRCIVEQQGAAIRANLVAACSDVGIYLNGAADSRVEDNTVVDTAGIDVRFATSSARLDGNLVDGPIRARDGGLLHLGDNETASLWPSYVGYHGVRRLFAAPLDGDFSWRGGAPQRRGAGQGMALCGAGPVRAYGAFDDFNDCLRAAPDQGKAPSA
ncbi:right-handed parallel beta-helix repeat-containing protein [uncultured Massilia sp.]|uniref:right-handed parallel beta-helix repeat-containing protein n=1 Tax=uncultured Massilia sp. TaxID=169973 RepID=UPI0025E66706|nr:right-handed parallel beta-helix repeat-containing protein [uncultured Massilia sp.]